MTAQECWERIKAQHSADIHRDGRCVRLIQECVNDALERAAVLVEGKLEWAENATTFPATIRALKEAPQ